MCLFRGGQSRNKHPCIFCTFPRCTTILAIRLSSSSQFWLWPFALVPPVTLIHTRLPLSLWSMTLESMPAPYFSLPTFISPPPITSKMSPFQHPMVTPSPTYWNKSISPFLESQLPFLVVSFFHPLSVERGLWNCLHPSNLTWEADYGHWFQSTHLPLNNNTRLTDLKTAFMKTEYRSSPYCLWDIIQPHSKITAFILHYFFTIN